MISAYCIQTSQIVPEDSRSGSFRKVGVDHSCTHSAISAVMVQHRCVPLMTSTLTDVSNDVGVVKVHECADFLQHGVQGSKLHQRYTANVVVDTVAHAGHSEVNRRGVGRTNAVEINHGSCKLACWWVHSHHQCSTCAEVHYYRHQAASPSKHCDHQEPDLSA